MISVYEWGVVTFFVVLLSLMNECSLMHAGAAGFLILLMICLLCASVGRVDGMCNATLVL